MGSDMDAFRLAYKHWGPWIVLVQGLTPIPYKLLTISSGFAGLSLPFFMMLSAITRGVRFFGEATLLYFFGAKVKEILDRYLEIALIVFLVLVVGGVFLARYVFGATLS
jgi:membrane protein DedA with SNARE-associated domain